VLDNLLLVFLLIQRDGTLVGQIFHSSQHLLNEVMPFVPCFKKGLISMVWLSAKKGVSECLINVGSSGLRIIKKGG